MGVAAADLVLASAIDIAREQGGTVRHVAFPRGRKTLDAAVVRDVDYYPKVTAAGPGLQVVGGRCVPLEAEFDELTVRFVKVRLLQADRPVLPAVESECDSEVCILGNFFSRNFTHWHEELMKVVVLEQASAGCTYVVSDLPPFATELLRMIGIPDARILHVQRPTRFRGAWYGTPASYRNVSEYPEVLLGLRQRLLNAAAAVGSSRRGTRLWLDRGPAAKLGRKLINQDEVHELLDRYGFTRVDMGELGLEDQIVAARDARAFAGLHGSQFVHSQLLPRRSTVIECFSPLYQNPTYTEIYRILQHRYSPICATNTPWIPYLHGQDVWVDCQQLDLALRTFDRLDGA